MTDIPIIYSSPMVRALREDRKTMTRRLAWRDAKFGLQDYSSEQMEEMELKGWNAVAEDGLFRVYKPTSWQRVKAGDRLWVRESAHIDGRDVNYMADYPGDPSGLGWRPSIHMPRWASRITLIVTAKKIEPLQDISEADAIAEGVTKVREHCYVIRGFDYDTAGLCHSHAVTPFEKLWQHLHGEEAWERNPDVVAISFQVHKCNIDQLPTAEAA